MMALGMAAEKVHGSGFCILLLVMLTESNDTSTQDTASTEDLQTPYQLEKPHGTGTSHAAATGRSIQEGHQQEGVTAFEQLEPLLSLGM
jgi:hypothetical protein